MRITKKQLKRIIREAMGPDHSRYGNDPLYVTTSDIRGHGQPPASSEPAALDNSGNEIMVGDLVLHLGYDVTGVVQDISGVKGDVVTVLWDWEVEDAHHAGKQWSTAASDLRIV